MRARAVIWLACLALVQGPALAADEASWAPQALPTRDDVLAMIDRLRRAPLAPDAAMLRTAVADFAKLSGEVSVAIRPTFFQLTDSTFDGILMAHYIAGAVEYDLMHASRAHDPLADVPSALREAVRAYRAIRGSKAVYENAFFEIVDAREAAGELERFVEVMTGAAAPRP